MPNWVPENEIWVSGFAKIKFILACTLLKNSFPPLKSKNHIWSQHEHISSPAHCIYVETCLKSSKSFEEKLDFLVENL